MTRPLKDNKLLSDELALGNKGRLLTNSDSGLLFHIRGIILKLFCLNSARMKKL
jgi:hypothetical protein